MIRSIFDLQIAAITCHNIPCKIPQITMRLMFSRLWYPPRCDYKCNFWFCAALIPFSCSFMQKCADSAALSESGKRAPVTACLCGCQWKICWRFWDLALQAWLTQCARTWHKVSRLRDEERARGFSRDPGPAFVLASGEVWAAVGGCQREEWNNYCGMLP